MDKQKSLIVLKDVVDALDGVNAQYWVNHGTLLGIIRDGAILDWDSDIDLGCWVGDVPKVLSACGLLWSKGYTYDLSRGWITIKKYDCPVNISLYYINCDFAIRPQPEGKGTAGRKLNSLLNIWYWTSLASYYKDVHYFDLKTIRNILKISLAKAGYYTGLTLLLENSMRRIESYYGGGYMWALPKEYFLELDTYYFEGVKITIPRDYDKFLEYKYGNDWRIPNRNWNTLRDDRGIRKMDFERAR